MHNGNDCISEKANRITPQEERYEEIGYQIRSVGFKHLLDPLKHPIQLLFRAHQRRGEANYVGVRFFAEQTPVFEVFAVRLRSSIH